MNLKISDKWLREYLNTRGSPQKISEYLSLCGPSVESVEKFGDDFVYNIEVTTNRVDCASVYGIAREAAAILPRFGIPAKLKTAHFKNKIASFASTVSYLDAVIDKKLCQRFTAVLIKNVKFGKSPEYIKERLEASGVRSLNNVVDISNYIMIAMGQPVHTFDYDKIREAKMILRESRKGEVITTLDDKKFTLPGGDIVIEDGSGQLIDLAGVMGGKLSAIDENTKNVLLFVQTYNPVNIRRTSMALAQRTIAATIFEKGIDTELVTPGILMGIDLFESLTGGQAQKDILNIYPAPYKARNINVSHEFIEKKLGVQISKTDIATVLRSLDFETSWKGNVLEVTVPSFRANDVDLPEDILEEIARIYGYHNLPSEIMNGPIPKEAAFPNFVFERKVKGILEGWGGTEVYTLSLVPKGYTDEKALKLKNPLGENSEYLRTTLMPSLVSAAKENIGTLEEFHLFEMSNVYIPRIGDLPEERLILAGIFEDYSYRMAKGIMEALLEKLGIACTFKPEEYNGFGAGKSLTISSGNKRLGMFGVVENSKLIYYEFEMKGLQEAAPLSRKYTTIPKYPAQIEDITFLLPEKTKVGEVIAAIKLLSKLINKVELKDVYENNHTFNIEYQDPSKTLTDNEVEKIRSEILKTIKTKFGGSVKD